MSGWCSGPPSAALAAFGVRWSCPAGRSALPAAPWYGLPSSLACATWPPYPGASPSCRAGGFGECHRVQAAGLRWVRGGGASTCAALPPVHEEGEETRKPPQTMAKSSSMTTLLELLPPLEHYNRRGLHRGGRSDAPVQRSTTLHRTTLTLPTLTHLWPNHFAQVSAMGRHLGGVKVPVCPFCGHAKGNPPPPPPLPPSPQPPLTAPRRVPGSLLYFTTLLFRKLSHDT